MCQDFSPLRAPHGVNGTVPTPWTDSAARTAAAAVQCFAAVPPATAAWLQGEPLCLGREAAECETVDPGCGSNHSLEALSSTVWFDPLAHQTVFPEPPDWFLLIGWLTFLGVFAPYVPEIFFGYAGKMKQRIVASAARWCGRRRVKAARLQCHRWDRKPGQCKQTRLRTKQVLCAPLFKNASCPFSDFEPEYGKWLASDELRGGYKRARKARRNPKTFSAGDLAKTLIHNVKMAVNHGADLKQILEILSLVAAKDSGSEESRPHARKVSVAAPSSKHQTKDSQVQPVRKWWTQDGHTWPYLVDPASGWWWWEKTESKGGQGTAGKSSHPHTTHKSVSPPKVVAIQANEWNQTVRLTSYQEITRCIQQAEPWQGNIVAIQDPKQVQELKDIYAGFSVSQGLTMILTGPAKFVLHTTLTRARLTRQGQAPQVEDVALCGLGNHPPMPLPPVKIDHASVSKVDRVAVQVFVPAHYRRLFVQDYDKDGVSQILAELSQYGPKVHHLTGGKWQWTQWGKGQSPDSWLLTGWLRLSSAHADQLEKHSGERGIFFSRPQDPKHKQSLEFHWIKKLTDETHDHYFTRVQKLAQDRSQTIHLRKGLGNDLGYLRKATDPRENRPRLLEVSGVPTYWQAEEITELLTNQKWTQVEIHNRRRRNKHVFWTIRAQPPDDSAQQTIWKYECDNLFTIIINTAAARPVQPVQAAPVKTQKKSWKSENTEAAPARGRSPVRRRDRSMASNRSNDRSRSARGDAETGLPTKVSDLTKALQEGWKVQDQLGNGDCGWRALADNIAFQVHGTSMSVAEATHEGNKLRVSAVQHIKRHRSRYEPTVETSWESFESYCDAAIRPDCWIDGVTLQSTSEKLGTMIIIWKEIEGGTHQRYAFAPSWSEDDQPRYGKKFPPLVLLLSDKHYVSVRPPPGTSVPHHWLTKTAIPSAASLRGAARSSCSSARTPSVRTVRLPRPQSGPRSARASSSRSAATPSVHTQRLDCSPRPASSLATPSVHTQRVDAQSTLASGPSSLRRRLLFKQSVHADFSHVDSRSVVAPSEMSQRVILDEEIPAPPPPPKAGGPKELEQFDYVWTCPYCTMVITAPTSKKRTEKRSNHLANRHPERKVNQNDVIRRLTPPVPVSEYIPMDQRSWTCPVCNGGLPDMSKGQKEKSINHHWETVHPGMNTPENQRRWRSIREKRKRDRSKQFCAAFDSKPHEELEGHETVRFHPHEDTLKKFRQNRIDSRGRSVTCRLCWRVQFRGNWSKTGADKSQLSRCPGQVVSPIGNQMTQQSLIWYRLRTSEPGTATQLAEIWSTKVQTADSMLLTQKQFTELQTHLKALSQGSPPEQLGQHDDKVGCRIGEAKNPGPPECSSKVSVLTCNVRSGTGAWAFLEHVAARKELQVVCLQETRMTKSEAEAFHRAAQRLGFRVFQAEGHTFQDRWSQPCAAGGLAVLVDKRLVCSTPVIKVGRSSQIMGLWIEDWFISTFYAPPPSSAHLDDPQQEVSTLLVELMGETHAYEGRWVFCGDANETPDDSVIGSTLHAFGGTVLQIHRATRWESETDREIDWFSTNEAQATQPPQWLDVHVSDHIPLRLQLSIRTKELQFQCFQAGPKWDRPPDINRPTWNQHVATCWDSISEEIACFKRDHLTGPIEVNKEWDAFLVLLDKLFRCSFDHLRRQMPDNQQVQRVAKQRLAQTKVKGRMPALVSRYQKRCRPLVAQGDMQLAKLRKRVARLFELKRCLIKLAEVSAPAEKTKWETTAADLIRKLRLANRGWSIRNVLQELTVSRTNLTALEKNVRERRLQNWKERIDNDISFTSKWLKKRFQPQNLHVKVEGAPPCSDVDGVKHIRQFWEEFWSSMAVESPDTDSITHQLLLDTPLQRARQWTAPSAELLKLQAAKGRGSSGTDGWSGDDLSALPLGAWQLFSDLANRWLEAEEVPEVLLHARAVFLPKSDKVEGQAIAPGNARPITILSTWWRTWQSAWLQSEDMKDWIPGILDDTVAYGAHADAQVSAAKVLDAFGRQGFLASLDFTKCFDLLRPQACAALLVRSGFCPKMSKLCSHFWTHHVRWCQWQQATDAKPLQSGLMAVPQGDPWGPLMAALYLSAGQRCVRRQLPTITMECSNYMDDRSFAVGSLPDLQACVEAWQSWSTLVGLKESNKAQCTAKSKKDKTLLQAALPQMFVDDVVFLGVATRGNRRKNVAKEDARLQSTAQVLKLLGVLRLKPETFAYYARSLAVSKATYGWLARLPTLTASGKLWTAIKVGQKVARMSNKWIRAVLYGGLNHLDILTACNLLRVVYRLWQRRGATWSQQAGTPVGTLRRWLTSRGWVEHGPWHWSHEQHLTIDFSAAQFEIKKVLHELRDGWRLWAWDRFLHTNRHEIVDLRHTSAADLLSLKWEAIRKMCGSTAGCRTVALGATVSPAWKQDNCPWCHNSLGHWKHLAWECSQSPVVSQRPPLPTKAISSRLGWDNNLAILRYLGQVQHALWSAVYDDAPAAAAPVDNAGDPMVLVAAAAAAAAGNPAA